MDYGSFRNEVRSHLLEAGEIYGTDSYLERTTRVSLMEAFSYFPTLRPDRQWRFSSADATTDGHVSVIGVPQMGVKFTEIKVIPSGWSFAGGSQLVNVSASGVLDVSLSSGATVILTESGSTGWETQNLMYVVSEGGQVYLSDVENGEPLIPLNPSQVTIRTVVPSSYNTHDRLGPLEYIDWANRRDMVNGLISKCDLLYSLSPDRNTMLVHPIISFELILEVHYTGFQTNLNDDDELNIPEGLEDRFISISADYVRSRIAKDIDRDMGLSQANFYEFKRGLRSIFKEVPR